MGKISPPDTLEQLQSLTIDIAKKQSCISLGRKSYKVLAKLTEYPEYVATQSIVELAQWAQTSCSTLSRLATKLGYEGFNDFQRVFHQSIIGERKLFYTEKANELIQAQISSTQTPSKSLIAQLSLETSRNMNTLLADLEEIKLLRIADLLSHCRAIRLYGLRQMYSISSFLAYGLSMIRDNVSMLVDAGSNLAENLSEMRKEDVLIVISVHPYTQQAVEVTKMATKMGIHVLTLTDSFTSPLVHYAADAFFIPHKSSFISNSIGSYIVFCEGLINLVATSLGDSAIQTLKKREELIHRLNIEIE